MLFRFYMPTSDVTLLGNRSNNTLYTGEIIHCIDFRHFVKWMRSIRLKHNMKKCEIIPLYSPIDFSSTKMKKTYGLIPFKLTKTQDKYTHQNRRNFAIQRAISHYAINLINDSVFSISSSS